MTIEDRCLAEKWNDDYLLKQVRDIGKRGSNKRVVHHQYVDKVVGNISVERVLELFHRRGEVDLIAPSEKE